MDAKFLNDDELIAALKSANAAMFKDGRVVSWTSNGSSVTKNLLSRAELERMQAALAREARYRIGEGNEAVKTAFPRLDGWTRRRPERLGSFF
ncbi:MAG: hypothetical protein E7037_08175 [Verrucomicrobia bacterium]|nr:hypothetical protein [Verrucomicrobiota bacterium]